MEKITTSGMLGMSGKEFNCLIGDSREEITKKNPDLTREEIEHVYDITREETELHEEKGMQ